MRVLRRVAILVSMSMAVGCLPGCRRAADTRAAPTTAGVWFEEIGARAGIGFVHSSGHATRYYLPEIMGGGAAMFDIDNDGFLDLYFVQSGSLSDPAAGSGNRLYRNRGDGTFEDVTERSGAAIH